MTSRPASRIARADIWLVNFDPTIGDEIKKTRPAVVISIVSLYHHRLQIVVPITSWQARFANDFWMINLPSTRSNGLDRDSAANAFQIKSVSEERFVSKLGIVTNEQIDEITSAIAVCIGYKP